MSATLKYMWEDIEYLLKKLAHGECLKSGIWVAEKTEGGLLLIYRSENVECDYEDLDLEEKFIDLAKEIEPDVKVTINGWSVEKAKGDIIVIYRDRKAKIREKIEEICEKLREEEEYRTQAAIDTLMAMIMH